MPGIHTLVRAAALVGCAGLLSIAAERAAAEAYQIDAVHSSILFRAKHLQTSYSWGRFNAFSGKVDLDGPNPAIEVQVEVDSVDTGNEKRDQHLKAPDFFAARQYPTITFKSTKVAKTGDGKFDVEGTLTLHGKSHPIQVSLEQTGAGKSPMGGRILGVATEFTIKRSDYGMKFMLAGISDEVKIVVALECAAP
jgi:polyisoprenoid-binding protein YceI